MDAPKVTRHKFSEEEDAILVQEIMKSEKFKNTKGLRVWKGIQSLNDKLSEHTARSCQKRFNETLANRLDRFNISEDVQEKVLAIIRDKERRGPAGKKRRCEGDYTANEDMKIYSHIINRDHPWNTISETYWSGCELHRQKIRTCNSLRARARHLMLRSEWKDYTLTEKDREILEIRKKQQASDHREETDGSSESDFEVSLDSCASVVVDMDKLRNDVQKHASSMVIKKETDEVGQKGSIVDYSDESDEEDVVNEKEECKQVFRDILKRLIDMKSIPDPRALKYVENTERLINVLYSLAFPNKSGSLSLASRLDALIDNLDSSNVALQESAVFVMDSVTANMRILNGLEHSS